MVSNINSKRLTPFGVSRKLQKNSATKENLSFKGALTTAESKIVTGDLFPKARKALGLNNTFMITPDTSIGSSFSEVGLRFIKFMKKMIGLTGIQLLPQGILSKGNASQFSGSVFSIGEHIIVGKGKNTLSDDFKAFKKLSEASPLKAAFNKFQKTADWLERDSLYEALTEKHGSDNWENWYDEIDKNLFLQKEPSDEAANRIADLKRDYKEVIDFHKFKQFMGDILQQKSKTNLNEAEIKVSGDCLIGFSPREKWAYQSAFAKNTYVGCNKDDGTIADWGIPALDLEKIENNGTLGEAGKLMQKKFDQFFRKYDGARIDAAWELIQPVLYGKSENGTFRKDSSYLGDKILKIMDESAKRVQGDKYCSENICLEMLGGPIDLSNPILKGRTQIHHSIYQGGGWGSVQYYKNRGLSEKEFIFGTGTHDDYCVRDIYELKRNEQAPVLARNLKLDENQLKNNPAAFIGAKFAEIFTTENNFFTVFDAMGMKVRFNDQGINPKNWTAEIAPNYEEVFHQNLIDGVALNAPEAMAIAMKAKGIEDTSLIAKLQKVAEILKEKGPLTEVEANSKFGQDTSRI